jgi:hypothetical protein
MTEVPSDEQVARQILGIFSAHHVGIGGTLQRNQFFNVRDAYFQRGMSKAVESGWINRMRDRYKYELTKSGFVESSIYVAPASDDITLK